MFHFRSGDAKIVRLLANSGADLDARKSDNGWTAIMLAILSGILSIFQIKFHIIIIGNLANLAHFLIGRIDVIQALVERNVNLNIQNNDGKTALDISMDEGRLLSEY